MSDDFLRDSRFPDRPQHPDFWRLSNVVTKHDGASREGHKPVTEIVAEYIDAESLLYMAQQRAGGFVQKLALPSRMKSVLASAIIDGVIAGIAFEKEGGHRDG